MKLECPSEEVTRIAALCTTRWHRDYTRIKLRSDPVYAAALREIIGTHLPVLDIGCGTGYFMDLFPEYVQVNGIDLNKKFLEIAKEVNPNANFYYGNYFNYDFKKQFDLIYLFGVLMYFEPSKLEDFFKRSHELLEENGILYFQYQHAVRYLDLYYPDLSYVKYSPAVIAKHATKYFDIEMHEHAFEGRKFDDYDRDPHYFPDGTERRTDTNLNNYLMIARKKKLVGKSRN